MAIDIQQPNYSGLVAIAGKSAPLNLTPTGALGLQALQQQQANAAAMRASALQRAQLQQQGQLALMSQGTQNRALDLQAQQQQRAGLLANNQLAFQRQQAGTQADQFKAEQAMKQQQMNMQGISAQDQAELQNRILAENTAKEQMKSLMNEKAEALHEKGAFAAYGVISLSKAQSPEEAAQIKDEMLKEAAAKKYMTPDEIKTARQMPLSQFQNGLKYKLMQMGQVKQYKDMMAADKSGAPSSGTHVSFNPDGSISEINVDPTSAVKTEAMKNVASREMGLQQLGEIRAKFDPKEFTYAGKAGRSAAAVAELSKGIPGVEQAAEGVAGALTGQSSEERANRLETATSYMNSVDQFFNTYRKEITGAAAAQAELDRLKASFINSDLSPSQFKGALDQLLKKYVGESDFNKNVLSQGINTEVTSKDTVRARMIADGHSATEVDAFLAKRGGK